MRFPRGGKRVHFYTEGGFQASLTVLSLLPRALPPNLGQGQIGPEENNVLLQPLKIYKSFCGMWECFFLFSVLYIKYIMCSIIVVISCKCFVLNMLIKYSARARRQWT